MSQAEFLEENVFIDLKNMNEGSDKADVHYFSESDFQIVLQKVEHFGIGIYKIESKLNGEFYAVSTHEEFKKKTTNPKWYNKAFLTFKSRQGGLAYSASYKVSSKLLARKIVKNNESLKKDGE